MSRRRYMAILSLLTLSLVSCTDLWAGEGIGFSNLFSLDLRRHSAGEGIGFSNIFSLDLRRYLRLGDSVQGPLTHTGLEGRKSWILEVYTKQSVQFTMRSDFDAYLRLYEPPESTRHLASGRKRTRRFARVERVLEPSTYRIEAASYRDRETGSFTLEVSPPVDPGLSFLELGQQVSGALPQIGSEGRQSYLFYAPTSRRIYFQAISTGLVPFRPGVRVYYTSSTFPLVGGLARPGEYEVILGKFVPQGVYRVEVASEGDAEKGPYLLLVDQGQRPKSALSPFTALKGLALEPSYPNPFNANTTIRYIVPGYGAESSPTQTETHLSLKIYSITGQLVRVLVDETLFPGVFQKSWDGLDSEGQPVASGLYIYYLRAGNEHRLGKMLLIK